LQRSEAVWREKVDALGILGHGRSEIVRAAALCEVVRDYV
jgi:hypothetical protein